MRPGDSLKERMAVNGYLLNGYCAMPSPFAAEIYARLGWDTVTIDMEHGSIGFYGAGDDGIRSRTAGADPEGGCGDHRNAARRRGARDHVRDDQHGGGGSRTGSCMQVSAARDAESAPAHA